MKARITKVLLFNGLILLICHFLFSPHFGAWNVLSVVGAHPAAYLLCCGTVALIAITGNYLLLRRKKGHAAPLQKEKPAPKDFAKALRSYYYKSELSKQMNSAISQIERVGAKENGLLIILEQYFDKNEITYLKFRENIEEVCALFYQNTHTLANAVAVFDEKEYRALRADRLELAPVQRSQKGQYYEEQFRRMNALLFQNEEIITTLDNLLLALSDLSASARSQSEKKQILEEMRQLTACASQYK
ncbi:MAG: hypothetical protein IJJ41_04725 [Clostridia bacterium]|nr:hypothetical protein [Clostridia bacterium]